MFDRGVARRAGGDRRDIHVARAVLPVHGVPLLDQDIERCAHGRVARRVRDGLDDLRDGRLSALVQRVETLSLASTQLSHYRIGGLWHSRSDARNPALCWISSM